MKKFAAALYFSVATAMMLSVPVSAYLDPSVMTYAIQIVAGIAVAVGAVAGIYWRRLKKKIQNKLGIDENAGKEVEDDIIIIDDAEDD